MKQKVLFLYGINHLQNFSKYKIEKNTRFLQLLKNRDVYFMTFVKKHRMEKHFNFDRFKQVIDGSHLFDTKTLKQFFNELGKLQEQYKFDKLYLNFMPLDMTFSRGNQDKLIELYYKSLNDDSEIKFNYIKNLYRRLLMPIYFIKQHNIPAIHIIQDPISPDYTKFNTDNIKQNKIYFYYPNKHGAIYEPLLEYGLNYIDEVKTVKEYTFTFGLTNIMSAFKNRRKIIDDLLYLEQKRVQPIHMLNSNIFIKDKQTGLNTYCMPEKYNDLILKSEYTLVINSYAETDISMLRFIQAITRDCIPIIHKFDNLLQIREHIGEDLFRIYSDYKLYIQSVREQLCPILNSIQFDNIPMYYKLMQKIKQTKFYKDRKSIDFYKESVEGLELNGVL